MPSRRSLLAGLVLLLPAGCAPPAAPPAANAPADGASSHPASGGSAVSLKVGLLTNGSLTDSGWNSLAGQALERMEKELGAATSHQSGGPNEAEEALRGFARDGFNLVFAHGHEFGDAALRAGREFPETKFVVSSGEVESANVASIVFNVGQATYLAGMLAAGLSRNARAGNIGGEEFPPVKRGFELFERGARAVNPKFTASTTYLGNWSDANAAKEKALSMIRAGADVLFQNCDAAGEGVFQAAKESEGVLVIGSNANQNELHPEIIPGSAVIDIAKSFLMFAREVREGTFRGRQHEGSLANGDVYLAINPKFESKIPGDVREKIRQAEAEIRSGKLDLSK